MALKKLLRCGATDEEVQQAYGRVSVIDKQDPALPTREAVVRARVLTFTAIGCESVPNRRETKRRLAGGTAKYVFNPVVRWLFRLGLPAPGTAILETTGRKSGRPRRNPVTNGLDDGVFWIVAARLAARGPHRQGRQRQT